MEPLPIPANDLCRQFDAILCRIEKTGGPGQNLSFQKLDFLFCLRTMVALRTCDQLLVGRDGYVQSWAILLIEEQHYLKVIAARKSYGAYVMVKLNPCKSFDGIKLGREIARNLTTHLFPPGDDAVA